MVKYHDYYGTKETLSFNPVVEFKEDSWVIDETDLYLRGSCYSMPKFYIKTDVLWIDFIKGCYTDREIGLSAGSFKILWITEDVINVVRYNENVKDITKQEVPPQTQYKPINNSLYSRVIRWIVRRLNEIS
jgi:hypothetical protein